MEAATLDRDVNRSWRIDDSSVGPSVRVAVTPRPAAKANGGGGRSSGGRSSGGRSSGGRSSSSDKIPRPPNAFMLYANTWRRRLAYAHPGESNKEISVRLGHSWKAMTQEEKETYFAIARKVDADHKKKYPDYVYNPKEARLRKALRDQGRQHRPRQKWKPPAAQHSTLTPVVQMLSQRAEEFRSEAMLQNYCDAFADLSYHHEHGQSHQHHHLAAMPPGPVDYGIVASPPDHPWYNSYIHGGLQNGGDFFGREKMNSDWQSYHHQQHQHHDPDLRHRTAAAQNPPNQHTPPYIPQHLPPDNPTPDVPYHHHQTGLQPVNHLLAGQQMQMESSSMMLGSHTTSSQDPLMINDVNGAVLTNGVDPSRMESSIQMKEDDTLPRLDGPQATIVAGEQASEQNRDVLKLPGFHQTFGNITEIGRFSQHDDYFESAPGQPEHQQQHLRQNKVPKMDAEQGHKKSTPPRTQDQLSEGYETRSFCMNTSPISNYYSFRTGQTHFYQNCV